MRTFVIVSVVGDLANVSLIQCMASFGKTHHFVRAVRYPDSSEQCSPLDGLNLQHPVSRLFKKIKSVLPESRAAVQNLSGAVNYRSWVLCVVSGLINHDAWLTAHDFHTRLAEDGPNAADDAPRRLA
ncbi:hypothetical protein [Paraburkholderia sp. EG304]|uniref:hypothetical protein n=1 Tax=Paraburkholderia sp. EG304 TaxID=3237015 RepID=UPI00397A5816